MAEGRVGYRYLRIWPLTHYALLALVFLVGLELTWWWRGWFWLLSLIFITVVAIGAYFIRREEGYADPSHIILPVLGITGLAGFAMLLPPTALLHLYFVAAALAFFWLLTHGSRYAYPTWNYILSHVVFLLNLALIFAWRFYFFAPLLLVLGLLFTLTWCISWQALRRRALEAEVFLTTFILAFVITEVAWTLQFLPAHFLIQAGIVASLHYVCFHVLSASLRGELQRRAFLEYIGVGVIALAFILLTAQWR